MHDSTVDLWTETHRETERQTDTHTQQQQLTGTTEALFANSQQHGMAVVTVAWFVEVLQFPHMLPILLYILQRQRDSKGYRVRRDHEGGPPSVSPHTTHTQH